MDLASITLVALLVAIIVSCFSPSNIGFLAIALAYGIGVVYDLPVKTIIKGFPVSLFLILVGVMLMFTMLKVNGTLEKLTKNVLKLAKGNAGLLPILIFLITFVLSSVGPGNIAMIALVAPIGMALAGEAMINPVMMAVMIVNGANAGALSPIAPTGIVSNMLTDRLGLPDISMKIYLNSLWVNVAVGALAYVLFGGMKLWTAKTESKGVEIEVEPFTRNQIIGLVAVVFLVCSVIFFKTNVGLTAFVIAVLFTIFGIADEEAAVKAMPWNAVMMVSGVSLLMEFVGAAGGLDIFTTLLAKIATPNTVTGVLGFICGAISAYSSSSGVVMPAFIPLVPDLITKMGGGDAIAMVSAIDAGAHVVDASPLSVGGALCIGCAAAWVDKKKMFKQLMAWGLSMSLVGGITCWILFTVLGL